MTESAAPPCMYLVICNISKHNNVKSLLQTAAAFDCAGIFVVGQRQFNFDLLPESNIPPSLHKHTKMPIVRFEKWRECVDHLKERDIKLIGVEIHKDAVSICDLPLENRSIAFLMGNEGSGLHEKHMASCQGFCKISQYGGGTASLNVNVACSIVLHEYQLKLRKES